MKNSLPIKSEILFDIIGGWITLGEWHDLGLLSIFESSKRHSLS